MSESQVIPSTWSGKLDTERLFYLVAGCALLIFVWMGFQQFYLHGRNDQGGEVTRQIAPLVFAHGIGMSAWILFFLTQTVLIVNGNRRVHMTLGGAGAVLAALLVIVGISTALTSVHFNPEAYKDVWGARAFLTIPLTVILSFGALVTIGLKNRHRPEVHRPMMLLATLFLTSAALFRMKFTPILMTATHGSMFFVTWGPMLILGALLLLLKWAMTRSFDRYFASGYAGILLACLLCVTVAQTRLWNQIAGIVAP